ncbi:uncharacterized protein LOC129944762 [Eupeodes corollae]|uniref:uncharacterized protein LOC129944762 n=1 Tax=Eupeodes corollae TaxID=290404 RepID=UPI002493784B|nr:uncharacterized protein LOC129944762 [Eupeodes corollae]
MDKLKNKPPTRSATVEDFGQHPPFYKFAESISLNKKHTNKKYYTNKSNTGTKPLYVATLNTLTLQSKEKFVELENALNKIHWDIIGLAEVRRQGESIQELNNGNIFAYFGTKQGLYGVGFLINKELKKNIQEIKGFNDRIIGMKVKVENCNISIIQVYAPTEKATDDEMNRFYKTLEIATAHFKTEISLIIGDFNAKLGFRKNGEETIMGEYGYGNRNERGSRLIQYIWQQKLIVGNSLFKKKPQNQWTWNSPGQKYKNQIDFNLCNKRSILKDVSVLNNFQFESDHRIVRAELLINHKTRQLHKTTRKVLTKSINTDIIKSYNADLQQRYNIISRLNEPTQIAYNKMEKTIKESADRYILTAVSQKQQKLSSETLNMIALRDSIRKKTNLNAQEKQDLKNIRKNIKKRCQEDIQKFNDNLLKTVIEETRSIKKAKCAIQDYKEWITAMADNNKRIHERKNINQIATNFYIDLYKTRIADTDDIFLER